MRVECFERLERIAACLVCAVLLSRSSKVVAVVAEGTGAETTTTFLSVAILVQVSAGSQGSSCYTRHTAEELHSQLEEIPPATPASCMEYRHGNLIGISLRGQA